MCLDYSYSDEQTKETLKQANGIGYKLFSRVERKLRAPIYKGKTFNESRWLNEKNYREKGEKQEFIYFGDLNSQHLFYQTGWHILTTLDGAIRFKKEYYISNPIIKKVRFRKVVAVGINDGCDCIVAKEMLVMKDEVKLQENFNFSVKRKR